MTAPLRVGEQLEMRRRNSNMRRTRAEERRINGRMRRKAMSEEPGWSETKPATT